MTYDEVKVPTFAELVRPDETDQITIFKCSGLTKRYLGPGWRMGWVVLFAGEKQRVVYRKHLRNILNIVLMPNTIMQCSVAAILNNPESQAKIDDCMVMMKANQATVREALEEEDYCTFGHSSGAFYATVLLKMERFKEDVSNTLDFSKLIYAEENVKFFPGDFFVGSVPFVRLVLSCNNHIVQDFIVRFKRFCRRHLKE